MNTHRILSWCSHFVNVRPRGLVLHWVRRWGGRVQRTLLLIHKHTDGKVEVPGCARWMYFIYIKPVTSEWNDGDKTPQTSWMLEQPLPPSLALAVEVCHRDFQKHSACVRCFLVRKYLSLSFLLHFCFRVNHSSPFNASSTMCQVQSTAHLFRSSREGIIEWLCPSRAIYSTFLCIWTLRYSFFFFKIHFFPLGNLLHFH